MWRCHVCKFLAKSEWDKEAHLGRVVEVQHIPHMDFMYRSTREGALKNGYDWLYYEISDEHYVRPRFEKTHETEETEWQPSPERKAIFDALRARNGNDAPPPLVLRDPSEQSQRLKKGKPNDIRKRSKKTRR